MLFHKSPGYSFLRVFGCLFYASTHSNDKFQPRAIKGVFVCYPMGQKGYKILYLEPRVIKGISFFAFVCFGLCM